MLKFVLYLGLIAICVARPNIVLFLMDDQDILINGMKALPKTMEIFRTNGIEFTNAFASTPVCCVSRGSILTGRYVHNAQIFNNSIYGGCGSKAYIKHDEPYSYASYLNKKANYRTFFSGKYLNLYGKTDEMPYTHVPEGWTDWYGLIGDAVYYNYRLSINGEEREYHGDNAQDYLPSVMHQKASDFLDDIVNTKDDRPFLISLAFPSGHAPWTPSSEYMDVLNDESITTPQVDNFNYFNDDGTNNDKGPVLRMQQKMGAEQIEMCDMVYRGRHGCFMAVDDIIHDLYQQITEMGEIDNTYFIYTSDHGFHIGQYGMWFGKKLLYDTDLRIPFFIRGPGIKSDDTVTSKIALTIDIAPTIVELATGTVPDTMDGESLVNYFNLDEDEEGEIFNSRQQFLVEYYGETDIHTPFEFDVTPFGERVIHCPSHTGYIDEISCDLWNNTFQCIRVIDGSKSIASEKNDNIGEIFCKYTCFNDEYEQVDCTEDSVEAKGEYYNLDLDPWQLTNTYDQLSKNAKEHFEWLLDKHLQCENDDCMGYRTMKDETLLKKHQRTVMDGWKDLQKIGKNQNNTVTVISVVCGNFIIGFILAFIYFKYGCCLSCCYNTENDKEINDEYKYSALRRAQRYGAI